VAPERLTPLDASFLYLERPTTHMHVAALTVFDPSTRTSGGAWFKHVRRTIESRLSLAPRFRQKVVDVPAGLGLPVWADDEAFDLDLHVRHCALPSPGSRRELIDLTQDLLSRPLDRRRPLWELTVIEGLEGGHVATLMKVHHALMDGLSGMLLASTMYDLDPTAPTRPGEGSWRPDAEPSMPNLAAGALRELVSHPLNVGADVLRAVRRAPRSTAAEVTHVASGVREILDLGPRPRSPFDVATGPNRRFATTEAPFERFREIKSSLGGTINDIVLTIVAAALHEYLRDGGREFSGRDLRVLVPVSVRANGDPVGNRVVPAFVDVPVDAIDVVARLELVRARTEHLKASSMVTSADTVIGLGAYAPGALLAPIARAVSSAPWFNLVVSNIPGPQQPLFLAGARLIGSYPSMPIGPRSALSIACTSLGGTMGFGFTADRDAIPDVDRLALALDDAVAEASKAARL
jgi:WS/DGAT/MGAT family acyltransferase